MVSIRSSLKLAAVSASAFLLTVIPTFAPSAIAKDFDVTGALDCGAFSGHKCTFTDWPNQGDPGPVLTVLSEDFSGVLEPVQIDISWVKDHLDKFGQDDFVWFEVRDLGGPTLQAVSVVEHRCNDGSIPHGQASHGRSNGDRCYLEQE